MATKQPEPTDIVIVVAVAMKDGEHVPRRNLLLICQYGRVDIELAKLSNPTLRAGATHLAERAGFTFHDGGMWALPPLDPSAGGILVEGVAFYDWLWEVFPTLNRPDEWFRAEVAQGTAVYPDPAYQSVRSLHNLLHAVGSCAPAGMLWRR